MELHIGSAFFLLATLYLSKHAEDLKQQAHFFGYWKKISEKEA
jgi:hypothetical protein